MGAPPAGASFGYIIGAMFIFNLVVGTGSLALPYGWNEAGLVSGFILTILIFLLAYICVTFVIEVQSVTTVMIEKKKIDEKLLSGSINDSYGAAENDDTNLASVESYGDANYPMFEDEGGKTAFILKQVEMGGMAETLLGKWGKIAFYAALLIYLYGDLAIYAVTVPQSVNNTLTPEGLVLGSITIGKTICYWAYLFIFSLVVLPFCFVNFSNSKYLQFFTIFCRNSAFFLMIAIAVGTFFTSDTIDPSEVVYFNGKGLASLWGTVIYCFMCHHSIPGLISPLKNKRKVNLLMFVVYCGILCFYLLLSGTALFAFGYDTLPTSSTEFPCQIQTVYNYNFLAYSHRVVAYYLGLFPVFTLTSSYPLIAITLRNNMMKIFPWGENASWAVGDRRQYAFAVIAAFPSLLLATVFTDVEALVSFTGSYAGLFIEFIIPVTLVYYAREVVKKKYPNETNPYGSPFQHKAWLILILVVAAISLVVVTLNNGIDLYNSIDSLINSD